MAAGAGVGGSRTATRLGCICCSMPIVNCFIEQIGWCNTHNAAGNTKNKCSITHEGSACVWLFFNVVNIFLHRVQSVR